MDYKDKYLKYKLKYLKLKKNLQIKDTTDTNIQIGGNYTDISHFWYKHWPDQGVPEINQFWIFINDMYNDIKKRGGGTVIHCSGGIGRTGTVYVILKLMNVLETNPQKNNYIGNVILLTELIKNTLLEARRHRPQMVERVEQYFAIYQIISKFLNPNFQLQNINRTNIKSYLSQFPYSKLQQDFCVMPEYAIPPFYTSNQDIPGHRNDCPPNSYPSTGKTTDPILSCRLPECLNRTNMNASHDTHNRYDSNPATTKHRVRICANERMRQCYINADFMLPLIIGGVTLNIIATQAPISDETIHEFKIMIKENNIKRIIMLTLLEEYVNNHHKIRSNDYFSISNTNILPLYNRQSKDTLGYFHALFNGSTFVATNDLNSNNNIHAQQHQNNDIYKFGVIQDEWFKLNYHKKVSIS